MSRVLSDAARELMSNPVGLEPVTIIAISWGSFVRPNGTIEPHGAIHKYADKDILDDNNVVIIPGSIMSMSDLDAVVKIDNGSSVGSLSVTLFDKDGEIKKLFDTQDLHKRPVIVYQHFQGLDPTIYPFVYPKRDSDPFEVFRGEVASPITWSEGNRTLSFDIISKIYELEAGFAPEQGQFKFVPIDLVGKPWPMVFGTPIHVPATRYHKVATGSILTTFGLPDFTLPFKRDLIKFVQEDLSNSYNYYTKLIETTQDMEIPAYQMQEDYAHHIVSHDAMKQSIEDLHSQIQNINQKIIKIIADYNDDSPNAPDRVDLLAELAPLKSSRNILVKAYDSFVVQAKNMESEAEGYKLRLKNAKYEITTINKLRKKCRAILGDYFNCSRQLSQIYTAIANQEKLVTNSSSVMIGPDFTQNTTTFFNVNGLTIAGVMSGYGLTGITPQPRYNRLEIGPRPIANPNDPIATAEANDITAFWLAENQPNASEAGGLGPSSDPNVPSGVPNLINMYLWLGGNQPDTTQSIPQRDPIDGRIVKVIAQTDRKVSCTLIRKQRNPRIKKQQINYKDDPKIKEAFEATLERLLTGNETEDQINAIANQIPRDLSPKIWDILHGGDNILTIELVNVDTDSLPGQGIPPEIDLDKSGFVLCYNNTELTDPIYFNDSASTIEKKILKSTLSIDNNDMTVTIKKYWKTSTKYWRILEIKYEGLMRPIVVEEVKMTNLGNNNKGKVHHRVSSEEPTKTIVSLNRDCMKPDYPLRMIGKPKPAVPDQFLEATIVLYFRGKSVEFYPNLDTANAIYNKIFALDPVIAASISIDSINADGGIIDDATLKKADFMITYSQNFASIFLDTTQTQFVTTDRNGFGPFKIKKTMLKNKFNVPKISVEVSGGGAHEFTYNERETKLQNLVGKNVNAPGIEKHRNKIRDLIKQMEKDNPGGGADQGAKEAIHNEMTAYREMMRSVNQKSFSNDEAYSLISDEEFSLLYDMEVTGYTEWVNSLEDIDQEFEADVDYEFTMLDVKYIKEVSPIIPEKWLQRLKLEAISDNVAESDAIRVREGKLTSYDVLYETHLLPNGTQPWLANVGDTITLAGNYQEKYVVSIIPGEIKAVYAAKQVAGIKRLIPVPSGYYIKSDKNNLIKDSDFNTYLNCEQVERNLGFEDLGLYHGVAITLVQPLSTINPDWSDELYVTTESVVGPNVCNIIAWLLATYTNLAIDLTTFQHVHALQSRYPMNFAIIDKRNVMQLCEELAWQARCTLWVKEGVVYIRYLPETPTPVKTITKSDIEQASLELSYTPTEDIITKLTANWRATYAQEQDYTMTLRRNLSRYNEVSDSREMYAYNIKDLVFKTATWWLIRRASTWRLLKMKLFMNNMDLETQDCIRIDLGTKLIANEFGEVSTVADTTVSIGPTLAIITKANYNSADFSIDVEAWLPIVAGKQIAYPFAFPKDLNIVDYWPLPSDIAGGDAGSPRNVTVPNGLTSQYGSTAEFTMPLDVGRRNVGDIFDGTYEDPSKAFKEVDYPELELESITIDDHMVSDLDNTGVDHTIPDMPEKKTKREVDGSIIDKINHGQWIPGKVAYGLAKIPKYDIFGQKSDEDVLDGKAYYAINLGQNLLYQARYLDGNTAFALKEGTPVLYGIVNGQKVFTVRIQAEPEITTDPDGKALDAIEIIP